MKAYSLDLRERVAAAVLEKALAREAAAQLFGVSLASVGRYVRARLADQDLRPRHSSGRPRRLGEPAQLDALRAHLQAAPDLGAAERLEALARQEGWSLSESTLWRAMRAVGWTHKKRA